MAMELRAALRVANEKRIEADAKDIEQVGLGMAAELGYLRGAVQSFAALLEQEGTPAVGGTGVEWHYRPSVR